MATLRTSFTITNETVLVSAANGRRTIGELVDMHINTEWNMVNDNYEKAVLSKIEISFDDTDADMLSRMYGKTACAG